MGLGITVSYQKIRLMHVFNAGGGNLWIIDHIYPTNRS